MPIFEFACKDGHEFQLWSDDARLCPTCGSEYLKRIFKTAPMIGTDKPARVDALVKREFDARGILNVQGGGHPGEREKVSMKSTPEDLAQQKIEREFPQIKADPAGFAQLNKQVQQKWSNLGVKGVIKSGLANQPGHEAVKGAILNAGKNDRLLTQRVMRKDPENLQVKR
jgi:putative FmdB family regulatory protein